MAAQQPVICNLLKLPPEQQVFFRMWELDSVLTSELDNLDAALEANQDVHSFHQVVTSVDELRTSAANMRDDLFFTMLAVSDFTRHYQELLVSLSKKVEYEVVLETLKVADIASFKKEELEKVEHEVHLKTVKVVDIAGFNEEELEKAYKRVSQLGESMKKAIRRVIDANDDDLKNNPKGFLCDLDTIQVIMELFQTISESGRLIRESRDYYRMSQTLSADDKLNLPSEGEITLMRERWFAFSRGIAFILEQFN